MPNALLNLISIYIMSCNLIYYSIIPTENWNIYFIGSELKILFLNGYLQRGSTIYLLFKNNTKKTLVLT